MRFSILVSLICFAIALQAQPSITKNDMPELGDTIFTRSTMFAIGVNYEQTGSNYTWDFSSLNSNASGADTFIAVGSTPLIYQLAFNLPWDPNKANLASPQADISLIPNLPLTDIMNFYKSVNASYAQCGFGATISGIPLPIKFDSLDVWYHFPLTSTSLPDSSSSTFAQGITGLGYISIERKRVNQVDGWGTVITPVGSYNALRIKSVVEETDSIYIDSLSNGLSIPRNYVEYKWLTNGKGLPVFQVTTQNVLPTFIWLDSAAAANALSVSLGQNTSICYGTAAVLNATASGGTPPYNFIWSNGTLGQTITVNPSSTSTYSVTVMDADFQFANASVTVTVLPLPDVAITLDPNQNTACSGGTSTTVFTMGTNTAFPDYLWWNGNSGPGASTVTTGPPIPNFQGWQDYWVAVTDLHGCIGYDTVSIYWDICTGMTDQAKEPFGEISIHPNPSSGEIWLTFPTLATGNMTFQVINLLGQEIGRTVFCKPVPSVLLKHFDIKDYTKGTGLFFIRVSGENRVWVEPVVIK